MYSIGSLGSDSRISKGSSTGTRDLAKVSYSASGSCASMRFLGRDDSGIRLLLLFRISIVPLHGTYPVAAKTGCPTLRGGRVDAIARNVRSCGGKVCHMNDIEDVIGS